LNLAHDFLSMRGFSKLLSALARTVAYNNQHRIFFMLTEFSAKSFSMVT
jgi:hypothetical protein